MTADRNDGVVQRALAALGRWLCAHPNVMLSARGDVLRVQCPDCDWQSGGVTVDRTTGPRR
jgi:hypothetical protein